MSELEKAKRKNQAQLVKAQGVWRLHPQNFKQQRQHIMLTLFRLEGACASGTPMVRLVPAPHTASQANSRGRAPPFAACHHRSHHPTTRQKAACVMHADGACYFGGFLLTSCTGAGFLESSFLESDGGGSFTGRSILIPENTARVKEKIARWSKNQQKGV